MIVFQSFYSSASSKSLSMVFWIDLSWQCDSDNVITTSVFSQTILLNTSFTSHCVTTLPVSLSHSFSAAATTTSGFFTALMIPHCCTFYNYKLVKKSVLGGLCFYYTWIMCMPKLVWVKYCDVSDCVSQQYFELDHRHLQFSLWFCSLSPNITKIYNSDVCISRYLNCVQWIPMRWCILQVFKAVTGWVAK